MKNDNIIEIILNSRDSLPVWRQRELAEWLTTTAQSLIVQQQLIAKKIFVISLKNSPPIHMS